MNFTKMLIVSILVLSLAFLVSCQMFGGEEEVIVEEEPEITPPEEPEVEEPEPEPEPEPEVMEAQSCTNNANCSVNELCIDGTCGTIAELYSTDCEETCSTKEVTVVTSDKTTHEFPPGKGSYTGAGALEWKIESIPKHCPEKNELVPFRITRFSFGEKIGDEVITIREGKSSDEMTHPNVKSVEFTLTVEDVKCE